MKVTIVYYSLYGHIHQMAQSIAEGAKEISGTEVALRRVPETLPDDIIDKMGATDFQKKFHSEIQECTLDDLKNSDAIIFGTPTRFGNMCGQMRQFLDSTGSLWQNGSLVGKVGSAFTSTASQHGGQESTLLTTHVTLLHHGMVIVGLPYTFQGQLTLDEISGGSPYGSTTICGGDGSRVPSKNELEGAKFQGKYVAQITKKLAS